MSTRSGRIRTSVIDSSPARTRKGVSPTRSPARTRKSSPPSRKTPPPASRSPGRKSPARKSPSRKPASKFPARKSPSRTTKEKEIETEVKAPKTPSKRPPIIESDVAVKLEDLSGKIASYRSTRSKRVEYTIKDLTSTIKKDEFSLEKVNGIDGNDVFGLRSRRYAEEVPPRRSSRLREFIDTVPDIRRSISKSLSQSKSISKSVSKSIDTFSDEENSEEEFQREKSKLVTRELATPLRSSISSLTDVANKWEFGGRIGSACLMLIIPLTVFSVLISCKKSCSFISLLDLSSYKSLNVFFSVQALGFVFIQYVIQAIFATLPILGTTSDRMDETGTKHCFNGFFSSLFTVILLLVLNFYQVINGYSLINDYLRLAVISYIFAIILSIVMYVKSRKVHSKELNEYGNTGYKLYDFFMGREIHPYIKKLDVKLWVSRISNINAIILLTLIFSQGIDIKFEEKNNISLVKSNLTLDNLKILIDNVQLQPTIILFSLMQLVYILSYITKEYKITTTFYWQCEGLGYLQIVSSALYPFYFTTVSKHVVDTSLVLSTNTLISASVIFMLGLLIMLISNNIKYEFRKNPLHHSFANIDSMPTFQGNKLLVGSLWGMFRHPNYTGDILIHIVFALPGILAGQYLAATPSLTTIVMLLHRAWRDHARCQRRYGAAWQRYCKRVPSVILPKLL